MILKKHQVVILLRDFSLTVARGIGDSPKVRFTYEFKVLAAFFKPKGSNWSIGVNKS